MHVLLVTFHLEGISEAEYYRECDESAPAFADIPGMIGKTWISDPAHHTFGGLYTFRDERSLDEYLDSDLFRAIGDTPGVVDLETRKLSVLEGPSRITHGWALQAV